MKVPVKKKSKPKASPKPPAPSGLVVETDLAHIAEQLRPLAVPLATLVVDPANVRRHPEKNLAVIAASLRVYGQRKPIVVNRRTGVVEAGNGTLDAARTLGWTHIAAVYVDDDPMTATGYAISDNRSAELAEWDTANLDAILADLATGDEALDAMLRELGEAQPKPTELTSPDEFATYDESIPTEHECPKCGYKFSGGSSGTNDE